MSSPAKAGSSTTRQPTAKAAKADGAEQDAIKEEQPQVYASIKKLIESVGVEEHDPQVVDMIIDFIYSYTTDVLRDAQAFGEAAGQPQGNVNLADVELAIHSRADMSFAQAPNLEALFAHAEHVNAKPLPDVRGAPGLPLPNSNNLLTANAQFRRDGDDPATVAGSVTAADPVVPAPAGVPMPTGSLQVQFAPPAVPEAGAGIHNVSGSNALLTSDAPANVMASTGAGVHEATDDVLQIEDVGMADEITFVPPP